MNIRFVIAQGIVSLLLLTTTGGIAFAQQPGQPTTTPPDIQPAEPIIKTTQSTTQPAQPTIEPAPPATQPTQPTPQPVSNRPNWSSESHQMMLNSLEDAKELQAAKYRHREQDYLNRMLDHHQSGVDMARMALKKSQNPVVLAESKRIIAEQTMEIAQMRRHLARPHRINRTAKPDPRLYPMMVKLRDSSRSDFDSMFLAMMMRHHQDATNLSEVITTRGVPHRAVKQMAFRIIKGNLRSQKALQEARGNAIARTMPAI